MVWTCFFIYYMNEFSFILCKILWCYHFCYDFIYFGYFGYTWTRICGYPNLRVVVFWGCFRVTILITQTFENPNYPTRTLRVTRTPRATLYNLFIVFWYYPLFVAICEVWPLKLTYGLYLVLSLKSGITVDHFGVPRKGSRRGDKARSLSVRIGIDIKLSMIIVTD